MSVRFALALFAALVVAAAQAAAAELNIYSARQDALMRPLIDAFTAATGTKVNLVTGNAKELIQRLKAEEGRSPADLYFTADAGSLGEAKGLGLFRAVSSPILDEAIPARYRDPEGQWVGLGVRARPIFYVVGRVDPKELRTYEDLANPKWRGRILVRSSNHVYNQSMLAGLIAHVGPEKAEAWAKGVAANLARKPQGGDRDQIKAAAAGEGDIAIVNTYYYAQMLNSSDPAERAAAARVGVIWPNQEGRGVHVNVSGAGVTRSAKNVDQAVKMLEFLVSDDAQRIYAEIEQEYPVKGRVAPSPTLKAMGEFKADELNLAVLAQHNAEAVRIFDRVGWR